ncbi:hypothetical protein L484_000790 [Morus notabilis]|uniref:Uncharacterized protein n=1 Tax=Morus notabilis TaxID=981085 RepID=W9SFG4_9ROSA|nr:hypothetical protein L484_000790 [Morus notabilis]
MENSTNSMNKNPMINSSEKIRTTDQCPEESSWTMYLEDFLLQNNNEYSSSPISSDYNESSLISDAGSSAINAKNFADNEENFDIRLSMNINRSCNGLSFKKRKTKGVLLDVALEDTASSPLNSPKVSPI